MDVTLSAVALLLLSPFLVPICIALLLTGEHYVFYFQERIGRRNKKFGIWKFATMLKNSPNMTGGLHTLRRDPRLLPFGYFLRMTKINAVVAGLIENGIAPGVYQLADGEPLSTNQIIRLIAEATKKRNPIWRVPPDLIRFFAKTGDVLHLPLNSERLKKLTESYIASNQKIRHALHWERMPVTVEEGIRKTLVSFASNR